MTKILNVQKMIVCSDPRQYSTLRAEPNWQVLGKRLGKAMGPVGAAVKKMDCSAIENFIRMGTFQATGVTLGAEDIKVLRDFKLPDGVSPEEMDAQGDGDLIILLDLKEDESTHGTKQRRK